MKILQFFFAILVFATTTSFSTQFSFNARSTDCNVTKWVSVAHTVHYPFRLDYESEKVKLCEEPVIYHEFMFHGNVSSDAQFFVAMGVIAMLLSVALLFYYCNKVDQYTESRAALVDFCLHLAMAVFLFISACAWSDGVAILKKSTDPMLWVDDLCTDKNLTCRFDKSSNYAGSFGKVNVSLIFGFLNVFLWASNLWFIYKERRGGSINNSEYVSTGNI